MKFLETVWASLVATDGPAVTGPGTTGTPPLSHDPTQATRNRKRKGAHARIEGLALRSLEALAGDVFDDVERVKWALIQPEVEAAASKFATLAALGEKRSAETREARMALHALLVVDLPSEWPENIDMLLDLMETDAWDGMPPPEFQPQPRRKARPEVPPEPEPEPRPEPVLETAVATQLDMPQEPTPAIEVPIEFEDGSVAAVEYELHALPGTSVRDADLALVRGYVGEATRRRPASRLSGAEEIDVMRGLKALDGPAGRERLTVLGGLFFASQPERLVVQSKVRFVEFPGAEVASAGEKVAYRYSQEVTGTIPQLIARMEQLHKERLAPGVLSDGFRMEELPVVPLLALREAMVNAVCHRDYSLVGANIQVRLFADRLEIQSPGGLPGPVTVQNILTESYARNPRVADMLRDLGYVERHGLGIDNMIKSMEEAHLPPPEFSNCETSFTVTLRFRQPDEADPESWLAEIGAGSLPHGHHKALVFARRMGRIANSDYQTLNLVDGAEATRQLRVLVRGGWLLQHGRRGHTHYTLGPHAGSPASAEHDIVVFPETVLDSLSGTQRRILDIVVRQRKVKAGEVLDLSALKDRRTVQRALAALTQRGLVLRHATSRTDPNASYEVNGDFLADRPPQDPLF